MTMPDNHPTPEEREGLIHALVDAMRCGPGTGHVFRIIPEIAVDNVLAAGWRPPPAERPKPEVGVEEWKAAGDLLYLLRDTGEFRRGVAQQANALTIRVEHDSRYATADEKASLVQAILTRLSEAAPPAVEGWRLVPIEPTEEMVVAHFKAHGDAKTVFASVREVWAAMLNAAPSPSATAEPEEKGL